MPTILTKEFQFVCPHGGKGTVPLPKQRFWRIGNDEVLLDGDKGLITGCSLLCCTRFSLESLKLTAVQCRPAALGQQHVMLNTDLVLTNCGFPMVITPPAFTVSNATVPATLLQNGQKVPDFLADESPPVVTLMTPGGQIPWSEKVPVAVRFSVTCPYIDPTGADVRLISKSSGGLPLLKSDAFPGPVFHEFSLSNDVAVPHETTVNLTPEIRTNFVGEVILLVRVASKRGVSGFAAAELTLVP